MQYNYGIVPYRQPITVVVGAPIRVDRIQVHPFTHIWI
jgi:hypothetical protein